jgi:hypothetical protein
MGSAIAVTAVVARSFSFFLFGLVLVGMARSAVDLGRFVAAEVHLPAKRGGPFQCCPGQYGGRDLRAASGRPYGADGDLGRLPELSERILPVLQSW